jgi:serine phosphatase RsbU (regulator of sigma subunit)
LPVLQPDVPGYEVAGWSQPADQTGGDYFDWQSLPNGNTVITLADVTGHGIGPALVTAVCRAYARASFPQDVNLGSVLDRINDLLCEDLKDGRFVTFVAAFFEPSSHSVQLLSAGHGPLLFYHAAEHRVEDFHAQDIPLGLSPRIGYGPPLRLALNPGDFLLLITDGFFEWPNAEGDQFGLERLERAILSAHDCSASELIRRLYEQVHEFAGGAAQLDDLTAVVLMRTRES